MTRKAPLVMLRQNIQSILTGVEDASQGASQTSVWNEYTHCKGIHMLVYLFINSVLDSPALSCTFFSQRCKQISKRSSILAWLLSRQTVAAASPSLPSHSHSHDVAVHKLQLSWPAGCSGCCRWRSVPHYGRHNAAAGAAIKQRNCCATEGGSHLEASCG